MPKIITVRGPIAAGKSTLTEVLRERLPNYSYVDRPFIKRGLKPAGKEYALRLSKKASYLLIRELVGLEQDIIVQEVNPESMKRKIGADLFAGHGYEMVSFYVTCSVGAAIRRDLEREAMTSGEERVREIHRDYAAPADYEIVIDTEKATVEACVSEMMSYITDRS